MKKTVLFALLALSFLTCRDPSALLDTLEDDVMSANDLYLEIVDISPAENGQYINPGEDIRIEFDRAIDMDSVEDALSIIDSDNVLFGSDSELKSLSYSFSERTNILTISASPYLDGLKQYTVSILDRIRGADGSALREPKEWSFSTSDAPRGYVEFVEDYTNDGTPDIHIYSQGATYYTIASTEGGIDWSTDYQLTGNPTVVSDFDISAAQGTRSVCIQFRDGYVGQAGLANLSEYETDTIVYDTTPPTVVLPSTRYGNIADPDPIVSPSTASDSLSGIGSYSWTGTGLSFGNASASSTTVEAASDGSYADLQLTVTDRAGNSASDTMTFIRDTVAPTFADAGADNASGSDLGTDRYPGFTPDTSPADISRYQFRLGNQVLSRSSIITSWASWQDFVAIKNEPVMNYGYTHIQFRSVDAAGNPCSSGYYDQYNYYVFPSSGTSPVDGGYISGDIAWPSNKVATHYKAYLGTSTLRMYEIVITSGKITVPRYKSYVDAAELSLSLYTTYYWYYEAYDGLTRLSRVPSKGAYSFRTSKF